MDYGEIVKRSWTIIWNNKFMIVLGFLAALGSGAGGSSNFNGQFSGDEFGNMTDFNPPGPEFWAAVGTAVLALLCLFVVVAIILWLVQLTAQAGLIDAASRLDAGEAVGFRAAFSAGWGKLLPMIGLNIILGGIIFVVAIAGSVVLALSAGAAFAGASGGGDFGDIMAGIGATAILLFCCFACVLVLLGLAISIIQPFAQRALVLENEGVIASIKRGWAVFRANLGEAIILLLLFLLIGFVVGAITVAVTIPFAALSAGPMFVRMMGGGSLETLDILTAAGGFLCLGIVAAVIRSVYVSWRSTALTLAYQQWTDKSLPAGDVAQDKMA